MVDTLVAGSLEKRRRSRRWSAEAKRAICLETRAPGVVVFVGQKKAVAIAVKNVSSGRRRSKLREWLGGRVWD